MSLLPRGSVTALLRIFALVSFVLATATVTGCALEIGDDEDDDDMGQVEEDEVAVEQAEEALAQASRGKFGLGHDAPLAATHPLFAELKAGWREKNWELGTARTVHYVSGLWSASPERLRAWVDGVKVGGMEPVVGVSVMRKDDKGADLPPVTRAEYRKHFAALLRAFPDVKFWGPVNEPDLELDGSSASRAKKAVAYYVDAYKVLRKCQAEKQCSMSIMLVAGEFAYQGGDPDRSVAFWEKYGDAMRKVRRTKENPTAPLPRMPRIWAFHPYTDATAANTKGTKRFEDFIDDLEKKSGTAKNKMRIWLTETGVLLHLADRCSSSAGNVNGKKQRQLDGGKAILRMNDVGRVDRVFWWHFLQQPGHVWDSAMVDASGAPRPSFCGLTKQPLSRCTGVPRATQCGALMSPP